MPIHYILIIVKSKEKSKGNNYLRENLKLPRERVRVGEKICCFLCKTENQTHLS